MKKLFCIVAFLLTAIFQMSAQNVIRVEAPDVVAVNEQFNVTFIIEGEKSPSDFQWSSGDDFQLVWGPQKGSSSSIQIINGKRSSSHQTTFTYILIPKATGTFQLPVATALLSGDRISSTQASIQVVSDGASSSRSSGQNGGKSSGGGQTSSTGSGEISSNDLFMRLSLSRTEVVIGEPITATLKIYQRANVVGFENAKFPTFNGFWSQETYVPNNIEFKRESLDDKIYNTAVLRTYVLIPQQPGTITIDPAELVCLVNIRTAPSTSNSLFDSFFQDEYRTIRKRVTTPAVKVKVNPLPAGQPASFGGGVGNFGISARLTTDNLKTHDAASLVITVSGRGNVALLEEPKVNFPPDFEVYDTKTTENTDKSNGGTSGSKSFEYPFIPRSHGDFTIEPVEYSYYDVNAGKYVTLRTEPLHVKVAKGKGGDSTPVTTVNSGVERKDVKSLADDIRFIFTGKPGLSGSGSFFVGSVFFWILLALMILGATSVYLAFRKVAAMRADVAGTKNRRATKMAQKRLKLAGEYLDKNLYTAFYEELHKALIGFVSDKLNMDMSEISKDNIASALTEGGVSEEQTKAFTDLLDACEFARYSPDGGNEAMRSHYDAALKVISSIDSGLKTGGKSLRKVVTVVTLLLSLGASMNIQAKDLDSLWTAGVQAYTDGKFSDASAAWTSIEESGQKSAKLYYNLGNAWFKQGNYPKAILNYERALRLDPSYSDARYNLEFTNNFVQDKIEPVPEFILKSFARKICYLMSSNAWAAIFLVLFAAALVMGLLFLLGSSVGKRRVGFYCGIVLLLLSAGALSFSIWQKSDSVKTDTAIVMSPVSSVKSSPSSGSSKDLFVIHEGTKVTILDEVGTWRNISLADGRQGWITSNELEVI
ncbi:putative BatD/BatE protein [Alistipes sp. CAG:435]|nr:putative BatD/BatE protein [Alistipes sp. CAG:435]